MKINKWQKLGFSTITIVVTFGIVEGITQLSLISPLALPPPSLIIKTLPHIVGDLSFLQDVGVSIYRTLLSCVIGSVAGIALGLLFGSNEILYSFLEWPLHALRSIPVSSLYPIFIIFFGIGNVSIIGMATLQSLLIVMISTIQGVRTARESRLLLAYVLRLGYFQFLTKILFYEALPHIMGGIRIAISYAFVLVIALELLVGGFGGLGYRIYEFQTRYEVPEVYASIIIAGTLGLGLNSILPFMESRLIFWKRKEG